MFSSIKLLKVPHILKTKFSESVLLHLTHNRCFSFHPYRPGIGAVVSLPAASFHTTSCLLKRRKTAEERKSPRIMEFHKAKGEIVDIWIGITPLELSKLLNKDINFVRDIFLHSFHDPNTPIYDLKVIQQALKRGGRRMKIIAKPSDDEEEKSIEKDAYPRPPAPKELLKPRPAVVTVMGHVDHGKTTLLDALRHSSVVEQEFGGITQHIGAFSVVLDSGARVTFLDTPGHAAFTAMRARGASVTDIVVLVVAADDGVMEQTVESVRMAKEARVPIIVAINKIDAPKADIARTERMLIDVGIQAEHCGGDVQSVPISALKRQNLDQLTEALVLQAELMDIGADDTGPVEAAVIESRIHPYRGKLSTIIVQRGTMRKGQIVVAGTSVAKVRALKDADGKVLEQVKPGFPAEVEGWRDLPSPGDQVLEVESEKRARAVTRLRETRKELEKLEKDAKVIDEKEAHHRKEYLEHLALKRKLGRYKLKREGPRKPEIPKDEDPTPSLNLVIKSDVDGTLEAVLNTLDTYDCDQCKMDLVHYDVGAVTINDVEIAKPFNGIIYAFNIDCPEPVKKLAEEEQVPIKYFNVIYKLVDDVKEEINKRLPQKEVEEVLGEAAVLQQFEINVGRKKVPVAGCRCTKGVLRKTAMYKLVRDGEIVCTGSLATMKHLKEDVDTIKIDTECGLRFADATVTYQPGDVIVCYEMKSVSQEVDWDPGF